jgi:hypothetical protein
MILSNDVDHGMHADNKNESVLVVMWNAPLSLPGD